MAGNEFPEKVTRVTSTPDADQVEATTVAALVDTLEDLAPPALAEDWDNVGLLLGDRGDRVERVMTCLTLTPDVAEDAIEASVDLVVTHHPVLFRAVKRIVGDDAEGRMLLDLIRAGVAVYCPHTGYDSAGGGINAQLAKRLGLRNVQPIRPCEAAADAAIGAGRHGHLENEIGLATFVSTVADVLDLEHLQFVGNDADRVRHVAVACGAAGEFLDDAIRLGCDVFITGETRFHTCLQARTSGTGLILVGHYASERPSLEWLADELGRRHLELDVSASAVESDPVRWV